MNKLLRKLTALLIVATMMLGTSALAKDYAQKFWDVPKTYWGFEYIADLAERGVIKGYEDGSFKPEATVSRSEWAKMMVDAAGLQANDNKVYFTDTQGHWANKYINAASNYLLAYTDGSYRPDQAATREDVTVAMVKLKGYNTSDVDYSYLNFRDNDSISNYAKGYVAVAIKNNLITGFEDNTFRGQDTLTRAEAATLMYRAFKLGNADKVTETSPKTEIKTDDSRKSDSDYVKQAEPKYQEPEEKEETKTPSKTENTKKDNTKNDDVVKEDPKDEEPEEIEEKPQPHYEITTLTTWSDISDEIGKDINKVIAKTKYKNGIAILAENCVISVDNKGKIKLLYDFDELPTGDVFDENKAEAIAMGYDESNDCLLVGAKYSRFAGDYAIYKVSKGSAEKIDDSVYFKDEMFILNNGNIVGHTITENECKIYSGEDYYTKSEFDTALPEALYDNGDYLTYTDTVEGDAAIFVWDYTSDRPRCIFNSDCDYVGIYDDKFGVATRGNKVAKIDIENNESEVFEIKIKDSRNLTRFGRILNVEKDGSFIFQDAATGVFRLAKFIAE